MGSVSVCDLQLKMWLADGLHSFMGTMRGKQGSLRSLCLLMFILKKRSILETECVHLKMWLWIDGVCQFKTVRCDIIMADHLFYIVVAVVVI